MTFMRIAISMPDELYEKLEVDRGDVPRATYIQRLIKGVTEGQGVTGSISVSKTEGSGSTPDAPVSDIVQGKTPGGLDRCISDADAVKMVESALELSDRENWETVKKVLTGEGYDWDIMTKELKRGRLTIKQL